MLLVAAAAAAAAVLAAGVRAGDAPGRRLTVLTGSRPDRTRGASRGIFSGALATAAGLRLAGVPAGAVVGMAGTSALAVCLLHRRRTALAAAARRRACIDTTYGLAAELRAGQPPAAALLAVARAGGPLGAELFAAATAVTAGADASDELARLAGAPGCRALGAVAAAWRVTEQHGGRVADVFDRLGEGLDAEERTSGELSAALAGPRSTILVLAVLPAFGVALGASVGAHPLQLLLHRRLGWALLVAALVLDLAGALWVRRLSRRALRG